jgi:hypothetical protein
MYYIKERSVLCPVIFIIEIAGISAIYKFVAKLLRAVCVSLNFGSTDFSTFPPRVIVVSISSFILAKLATSLNKHLLLDWCML